MVSHQRSLPPREGETAPDFALQSTRGPVSLGELLKAGPLVMAFYTEDDTPT